MRKSLLMLGVTLLWLLAAGQLMAQAAAESPALKPRAVENRAPAGQADAVRTVTTTVGGLSLVLGVFFVVVWLLRRHSPAALGGLPPDVFEILGRGRFDARHQVQLIRCGGKLLLVCIGANGVVPLTEISDPAEVERWEEMCRQGRAGKAAMRREPSRREVRDE